MTLLFLCRNFEDGRRDLVTDRIAKLRAERANFHKQARINKLCQLGEYIKIPDKAQEADPMQMKKRVKVAIKVIEDNLPQVYQNQISNRNSGRDKRMKTPNNPIVNRTHIETTFITGTDHLLSVPRTTDAPSRNKWLSNNPSPREPKPWQTVGRYSQSQATFEDILL